MNVFSINRRYRRVQRYRAILNVFVKHGLGFVIERLDPALYNPFKRKIKKEEAAQITEGRKSLPQRFRAALEELGPTFIKFGQLLSMRPDLIPENFVRELEKLQDEVEPSPFEEIKKVIEDELGGPIKDFFKSFDETPVGSASVSQAHDAILLDGTPVIVKVQRPGIKKTMMADIDILYNLARMLETRIEETRLWEPVRTVEEFEKMITRELDFTLEGKNADRFRRNFKDDPSTYIPHVYWELTTKRVLTLEKIIGIKVSQLDKLEEAGYSLKRIAEKGARAFYKMVLVDGFFHCDPHAGNLFVMPGEIIGWIDFGLAGRLGDAYQERMVDLFLAIMARDSGRILKNILDAGCMPLDCDRDAFKAEIEEFLDEYYNTPLKRIQMGEMISRVVRTGVKYRVRTPAEYSMLAKALVTVEGLGRKLDPDFDGFEFARPFVKTIIRKMYSPRELFKKFSRYSSELVEFLRDSPKRLASILCKMERGDFKIEFKHEGLESLVHQIDTSSNRLSFALIISAMIIGSSVIIFKATGPLILGIPALGFFGYLIAIILGILLLISILRTGSI